MYGDVQNRRHNTEEKAHNERFEFAVLTRPADQDTSGDRAFVPDTVPVGEMPAGFWDRHQDLFHPPVDPSMQAERFNGPHVLVRCTHGHNERISFLLESSAPRVSERFWETDIIAGAFHATKREHLPSIMKGGILP